MNKLADRLRAKKGMRVVMNDGWEGTVRSVAGGFIDCDPHGPNPHLAGRTVSLSSATLGRDGTITVDWKSMPKRGRRGAADLNALVAERKRARLVAQWNDAPLS